MVCRLTTRIQIHIEVCALSLIWTKLIAMSQANTDASYQRPCYSNDVGGMPAIKVLSRCARWFPPRAMHQNSQPVAPKYPEARLAIRTGKKRLRGSVTSSSSHRHTAQPRTLMWHVAQQQAGYTTQMTIKPHLIRFVGDCKPTFDWDISYEVTAYRSRTRNLVQDFSNLFDDFIKNFSLMSKSIL